MTDERRREILDATRRVAREWLAKPLNERTADLQRIGILDDAGHVSSRYGGPGKMTTPDSAESREG